MLRHVTARAPSTTLLRSVVPLPRCAGQDAERKALMPTKYPGGMRLTQWRRTPFRTRHRLLALAINNALGHWRSCVDRRCRRARFCQDHECYWRRLEQMTYDEQMRLREATAPLVKLLWIGCIKGSEGRPRF
jgi:hypothetical protein